VSYEEHNMRFQYLVTAEHVISGRLSRGHTLVCRINLANGQVGEMKMPNDRWLYYPDDRGISDVAVCPISDHGVEDNGSIVHNYDIKTIRVNGQHATTALKETIAERKIGVGDEVAIAGLFRSHFGHERNVPIVRIGNIAMLEGEPVKTHYAGYIDAYLIEARSIAGLSGSPVFVNLPALRVIGGNLTPLPGGMPYFFLLGLMHGHFDVENLNEDSVVDDASRGSGINTGIGIVIPVEKIMETIEQPELAEARRRAAEDMQKTGATPDTAN
jgi:hypothetical protein